MVSSQSKVQKENQGFGVIIMELGLLSLMTMTKLKCLFLECSHLQLSGVARFSDGTIAEPDIPLVVTIEDQNDNPPYFEMHSGNITERSKKGRSKIKGFVLLNIASFILFYCHAKKKQRKFPIKSVSY